MHPNLFISVLIALLSGFAFGALVLLLLFVLARITQSPRLRRMVPGLLALALCLALLRLTVPFRGFVERLAFQHDLHKLVVLGLLVAALAVGFRLAVLILRGDRK